MMKTKSSLFTLMVFIVSMLYSPFAYSGTVQEGLIEKANSIGSVRVIVRLNTDYEMESNLSSSQAVQDQRSRIAQEQGKLLNRMVSHNVSGVKKFVTLPFVTMTVGPAALEALSKDFGIIRVKEDIPESPALQLSVPFINANDVHAQGFDGSGTVIAILDTGVLKTHEFLDAGKVVYEACFSTDDAALGATTLCPDGSEKQLGEGAGVNCSLALDSRCDHGTHVAGIAAGVGGLPGVGVAPGAQIISVQVFSLKATGITSYATDQALALEHLYLYRDLYDIAAVNLSIGGGEYNSYCDVIQEERKLIIDQLRAAGIATVIASGNDGFNGSINSPGCISTAVTVGATLNNSNIVADYSNHAYMVDMMAPGSDIYSSIPTTTTSYESKNGTSMATPHVAGAFAIMKHKFPTWSVARIETALEATGVDVTRADITKRRIDLLAAAVPPDLAEDDILDLVAPTIIAAVKDGIAPPPVLNPQWGAYTEICCDTSSLTYGVTQSIQYRSSTIANCTSEASFSGYLVTTPGSKFFSHQVTSSTCTDLVGSGSFTLDAGKRYLWVAEYNSGNPQFVIYSEDLSTTSSNTLGGDFGGIRSKESMDIEFSGPLVPAGAAPEGREGEFQGMRP